MTSQLIGYARVSTTDQTADLQQDALTAAGCSRIFTDTMSGSTTERPALAAMMDHLRSGDTLVVWKLDRLGRSLQHLLDVVTELDKRGVEFRSLSEALDTTTAGGRLIFSIFGAIAEFERNLIQERTRAGLTAARARGRVGGRPHKLTKDQIRTARKLYEAKDMTVEEIGRVLGVSRSTINRVVLAKQQPAA
jgi:DNA invertase Pin-like site-specific DNA recombinase